MWICFMFIFCLLIVGSDVSSDVMLVDYLRMRLELRGTKYMCREGACGACIVSVTKAPGEQPIGVNSCLVSITSCHGWEITTVEKVGNRLDGYHPIQKTLAKNNGTQCGHCTTGWVMSMYSLAQSKKDMTKLDIEKSFGSNICRCTGYRPILDTFKKFAVDAEDSQIADIEDLYVCKKINGACNKSCAEDDWCFVSETGIPQEDEMINIELKDGKKYYRATEIKQIFDILRKEGTDSYMFVAGNTAKGIFPIDEYPQVMIDISTLSELKGHSIDQNLVIGAGNTLTETIEIFETVSKEDNFDYLQKLADHIKLVAHIPVRNLGTIAGNLFTKHSHNTFQSDIFLLLETVNAYLTIYDPSGSKKTVKIEEFLDLDMKAKLIYNVLLPPLSDEHKLVTYKIMRRAQAVIATLNAGFLYKLDKSNKVIEARIFYGDLSPTNRLPNTENHLIGKDLFTNATLQSALRVMDKEIVVEENPPKPSAAYRKQLALSLFYKSLLLLCPQDQLGERYRSGAIWLRDQRPVSQAKQEYTTDPSIYPLNEAIPKVEALIQCSGEAKYTEDIQSLPGEVFGALVLSTVAQGDIENIDPSEALNVTGTIAFYSAKDIPGKNSFALLGDVAFIRDEEVFCSNKIKYFNQPIGIIIAETKAVAERAAKKVKVQYSNVKKPVIDIKETRNDKTRTKLFLPIPAIGRGLFVKKKFKSNYTIRAQHHFPMETIACVTRPSEQGLEIHTTSQWLDAVQYTVAKALNIDMNGIDVYVSRLGGTFGLKLTRNTLAAVACSIAAFKLNRPVRLILPFETVARALGKRFPCSVDVEVEVNAEGSVQHMNYKLYEDNGYIVSELISVLGVDVHNNVYKSLWWNYSCFDSTTDTARNTYCRAPGAVENISAAENVMEQISYELSLDPFDVRITNLDTLLFGDIKTMAKDLKEKAEYTKRKAEVEKYNAENRWKKRGLRWSFMRYTPLTPAGFEVNISVCHGDGSVIINHGGIELGQGINTKAIQICAHILNIPVDKIKVKGTNSITTPNSLLTSTSITSQSIGMGVERCCKELLLRLAPVRLLLLNPSWEQLIRAAYVIKIDLQVHNYVNDILSPVFNVYGVALAEVEVDILTGESQVLRVDLLEDVGRSVSPGIDIGQVEGAFIMGLGYWTCEEMIYNNDTGELLTNRPSSYLVPQARDIPQDFRVYFREKSYSAPIVLGSKVTGEPATCLAISVPFAMREAVTAARKDAGIATTEWFTIDGPYTFEKLCLASGTKLEHFKFK